jgi:hypothetical protein
MNAWIDCLTYLDLGDGMSRFHLQPGDLLRVEVLEADIFMHRAPDVFARFVEATAYVSSRPPWTLLRKIAPLAPLCNPQRNVLMRLVVYLGWAVLVANLLIGSEPSFDSAVPIALLLVLPPLGAMWITQQFTRYTGWQVWCGWSALWLAGLVITSIGFEVRASVTVDSYVVTFIASPGPTEHTRLFRIARQDGRSATRFIDIDAGACRTLQLVERDSRVYFVCNGDPLGSNTPYVDRVTRRWSATDGFSGALDDLEFE